MLLKILQFNVASGMVQNCMNVTPCPGWLIIGKIKKLIWWDLGIRKNWIITRQVNDIV